jgi:hypothetical protein
LNGRAVIGRGLAGLAIIGWVTLASAAPTNESLEGSTESGPVQARVSLAPAEPTIGDPLVLELEVSAQAGVELLMPEFGEALDRFSIVNFSRSETADDSGGTLSRQTYTLAPSRSGSHAIPPLLIEFIDRRPGRELAPEGEDAYELLTQALDFEVSSALPEGAPLELRAALGKLGPRELPGQPAWLWLLAAAAALAVAAPFGVRAWAVWRSRARQRSAYDVARAELDALIMGARPNESDMDAFFVRLSGVIRRYLEDRFGLRSPELTTEEFLEELAASPDLLRTHQQLLRDFLKRADLVKFAHLVPTPGDVEESLDAARRFLETTSDEVGPASAASSAPAAPAASVASVPSVR